MNSQQQAAVGVDVGASRTKVAIIDAGKNLKGYAVIKSGTDFRSAARKALAQALDGAGIGRADITAGVSTGYGRKNVDFVQEIRTEIACHAKGCYHEFPLAMTIVDIGGQDNKIINLDRRGRRVNFKMNRKCAAGTGAFLEEMALRLDIPLEKMNELAEQSREQVELGSYCTVFSATEVLEKIRQGKKLPDIVKGLYSSVIKRVLEMGSFCENIVMTGGVVAFNPCLVKMAAQKIGRRVLVPEFPQLTGAIGAALFGLEQVKSKE